MRTEVEELTHWLADPATRGLDATELVGTLAARLNQQGFELARLNTSIRTKHPEIYVENVTWTDEGVTRTQVKNSVLQTPVFLASPLVDLAHGLSEIRSDLDPSDTRYPILADLRDLGHTGYVVFALPGQLQTFLSMSTVRPGGFQEEQLEFVRRVIPVLSMLLELASERLVSESLLTTYLGRNAARRVLDGEFVRGSGETITAIIWSCDLRGFTQLVDRHPMPVVLDTLDTYFRCAAGPIQTQGGEILKFIGDAVLAIWPVEEGDTSSFERALSAARTAFADLKALRGGRSGLPKVDFGVALHVGEVTYGNIGTTGRLDFTVIGGAVNEVSRVEGLCKTVSPLLVTRAFYERCPASSLVSVGHHELRGVAAPLELYTAAELVEGHTAAG